MGYPLSWVNIIDPSKLLLKPIYKSKVAKAETMAFSVMVAIILKRPFNKWPPRWTQETISKLNNSGTLYSKFKLTRTVERIRRRRKRCSQKLQLWSNNCQTSSSALQLNYCQNLYNSDRQCIEYNNTWSRIPKIFPQFRPC